MYYYSDIAIIQIIMFDAQYSPLEFDVLLTDVHGRDLRHDISNRLGVVYLSECENNQTARNVNGIIWGPHNRLFIPLKVSIGTERMRNVHMIVDTGSPQTYLCGDVFSSFNRLITNPRDAISININGSRINVLESPAQSHFNDVNLLGSDYLQVVNGTLTIDYGNKILNLHVPEL